MAFVQVTLFYDRIARRRHLRKAVNSVVEEMVPKVVVDILMQQVAALQATVRRVF